MKKISIFIYTLLLGTGLTSCNDFLDNQPESQISSSIYFSQTSELQAYCDGLYSTIINSHQQDYTYGLYGNDIHTDNQAYFEFDNRFVPGQEKVQTTNSDWYFKPIYSCNYFLNIVKDKFANGEISGSTNAIRNYIGEMNFLRASEYFKRYCIFGDFPIITKTLEDNKEELVEASKRYPRNEVARFILNDLDSALVYLNGTTRTRITAPTALLLKSRVALYEGTWLKYFKGTAFVPNGSGWPGAAKKANYQYPSGNIDNEIKYFLQQSMDAAKKCSESFTLTTNTGTLQQSASDAANPYMDMFGQTDLSGISEVLMWHQYATNLICHNVVVCAQSGNCATGVTRGMVNGFLMSNGLPIYASESGYAGDDYISDVRKNRDSRLALFLKEPGQKNILFEDAVHEAGNTIEPYPKILDAARLEVYPTGYALRKGNNYYESQARLNGSTTGCIIYRGAEAYLNYMEAEYELNGKLDDTATAYWVALRKRANVSTDIQKTIDATDISQEAPWDWGAYSGGQLLTDKTLYNIRRERRCEFMSEGLRWNDLCRWRAMDQMITTPYHIEGFKLWGPMQNWFVDEYGENELVANYSLTNCNVNPSSRSLYLRPYEKVSGGLVFDGYKWAMAHYLSPIPIKEMQNTATDANDLSTSVLYQNPYWPTVANEGAEK